MERHAAALTVADMSGALLRAEEVALLLSVSRGKVYDLMRSGALRSLKIDGSRRITPAAVADFIASLEGRAA